MVVVWRALYRCLDAEATVRVTSWILRALSLLRRRPLDQGLLAMLERRLVWSGWPHQSAGWVNLHVSRFASRVRRSAKPWRIPKLARRARHTPLRIGLAGPFSGLLGFPLDLFEACPPSVAPYIFD